MKRLGGFLVLTMMVVFLVARGGGQDHTFELPAVESFPDAPQPQPSLKPNPWRCCWTYPNVPTRQVLRDPTWYAFFLSDFALSTAAAQTSYAAVQRGCIEVGAGFSPNPSMGNYLKANAPENIATLAFGFLWLKVKGPHWALPLFLSAPAIIHGRNIYQAVNCR